MGSCISLVGCMTLHANPGRIRTRCCLTFSAPALLSLAVGHSSALSFVAFSLPLARRPVLCSLRGGGGVLAGHSHHRRTSTVHGVQSPGARAFTMQAPGTTLDASNSRIKVVVISGPTAVGKSALAESIAQSLQGGAELISADSVQVYIGMDIGSAKPTREERAAVKYHLLDIAEPTGLALASFPSPFQLLLVPVPALTLRLPLSAQLLLPSATTPVISNVHAPLKRVCACVCACVRVCTRARVQACMRACLRFSRCAATSAGFSRAFALATRVPCALLYTTTHIAHRGIQRCRLCHGRAQVRSSCTHFLRPKANLVSIPNH